MIGQKILHYTILEKLGEGGMGVVYKAEDTRLGRTVALKFLPDRPSAPASGPQGSSPDSDRNRFLQEARAASLLNHPNVCTIHDIQEHEGRTFIVMEYVDGQTLRRRLATPIPLKSAIDIGTQLAEGLAAAHEKGIVHRDMKPENVMIRRDGIAQIMDFGLAKLQGVTRLTREGSTVGTAGYMSPEQVQGHDVDHRSDIFSLGVMLYEMIAGRAPFSAVHESAMMYEIVNVEPPPMTSVKQDIDPGLDALVLECMAKDPADRCQSAAELARNLKRMKHESSRRGVSTVTASRPAYTSPAGAAAPDAAVATAARMRLLPWISGALAIVSTAAAAFLYFRPAPAPIPSIQAFVTAPKGTMFHSYGNSCGPVIVSPDGRMLAFVAATAEGRSGLYLRPLDAGAAVLLPGTEGAYYPFWSHDSKWVAFFSLPTGKLKKVDIQGNPPVTICDGDNGRGGSWGSDDVIVFAPGATGPLVAVPASGGTPRQVTQIDTTRSESSQRWPCFLPDGKRFLYFSRTASFGAEAEGDAIMAASLDGGPPTMVVSSSANAQLASGYLLYMRGSSLLAQRFDEGSLAVTGDAMAVAEGVINDAGFSLGVFSASQNGVIAYQTGVGLAGARMVILDREGKELGFVGDVIEHFWPRISPDGGRVILGIFEPKSRTQNLWMYDLARGSRTRFTTGLTIDFNPVWSPDGRMIAHGANRGGTASIHLRPAAGGGTDEVVLESDAPVNTSDWSPDGTALCLNRRGEQSQADIWILPLTGEKKPREFVRTAYNEHSGRFSPDGRWIAYVSEETGQDEIFLRPYPGPGTALKVTDAGGRDPAWRRDGRELFYVSADNKMMAVEIRSTGSSIEAGTTRTLFVRTPLMSEYDPFPDGKRFLVNRLIEPKETEPITIVTNWTAKLRK